MKVLHLAIELLEPVVLSESSGTEGIHRTVRHLPGAVLRGVVGGRAYGDAERAGFAWELFHSGRVRFDDAWLTDGSGRPGLPIPLSFAQPKGAGLDTLATGRWRDHAFDAPEAGWDSLDGDVLLPSGRIADVRVQRHLKTAVDRHRHAAQAGSLFSYEAISAGQVFAGRVVIDLDGEAAASIEDLLRRALLGKAGLGRSRSAQFGRVQIREVSSWNEAERAPRETSSAEAVTRLFLASDACLIDPETGQASGPSAASLGLDAAVRVDLARSTVRFRRWTPFNGQRRRPDLERIAVRAGSVITLRGPAPALSEERLADLQRSGVGLGRSEGLGRLVVDPTFLGGPGRTTFAAEVEAAPPSPSAPLPSDRLGRVLAGRIEQAAREDHAWRLASAELDAVLRARPRIQAAQWEHVARAAHGAAGATDPLEALDEAIGEVMNRGVARKAWRPAAKRGRASNAADALEAARAGFADSGADALAAALATEFLARRAARDARRDQKGGR